MGELLRACVQCLDAISLSCCRRNNRQSGAETHMCESVWLLFANFPNRICLLYIPRRIKQDVNSLSQYTMKLLTLICHIKGVHNFELFFNIICIDIFTYF